MTDRAKFEQMLEYLINEDKAKAEELFHELVVAKSREIYENLLDDDVQVDEESDKEEDEEVEENFDLDADLGVTEVGGDPADDMMSDVEAGDDEEGDEMDMGDEEGGDEPATKDDVMDIKDALEDLKAEFEAMLAGKDSGEEEVKDDVQFEASDDEEDEDDMEEGMVREYVEKVSAPAGGDNGANAKSVVAKPNNMGGTTANIAKGGESTKGGTQGGLANPSSKEDNAGNVNVPGAKKAATLNKVSAPKGGDDGANKKSTLGA